MVQTKVEYIVCCDGVVEDTGLSLDEACKLFNEVKNNGVVQDYVNLEEVTWIKVGCGDDDWEREDKIIDSWEA